MRKHTSLKISLLFGGLILLWLVTAMFKMKVLWFVVFGFISVVYIIKNRNIKLLDIIIGCGLGIVAMPASLFMGIFSIIIYIGAVSILKTTNNKIILIKSNTKKDMITSCIVVILVGVILGTINIMLALLSNQAFNPSLKLSWMFEAVKAGVSEEIIFRLFPFALCAIIAKDQELTKFQNVFCYLIMVVPHVLLHFDLTTLSLMNAFVLSILFGLPFAILQRKRDLISAIGSHTLVDAIRFCLLSA